MSQAIISIRCTRKQICGQVIGLRLPDVSRIRFDSAESQQATLERIHQAVERKC
jgi:hypothetical protein